MFKTAAVLRQSGTKCGISDYVLSVRVNITLQRNSNQWSPDLQHNYKSTGKHEDPVNLKYPVIICVAQ